jgi:uncharacterized protein with von Willebrand factor type A (vWA) domain
MPDDLSRLFLVFDDLRQQGVPLGVPEYMLALRTIGEGVGSDDVTSLKRVCRLLWAKSQEDQQLFDAAFTRHIESWLYPPPPVNRSGPPSKPLARDAGPGDNPPSRPPQDGSGDLPPGPAPGPLALGPVDSTGGAEDNTPAGLLRQAAKYQFTLRLPIGRREMTGIWRHLRRFRREGPPEDLDVEGTISNICRTGFFLRPVLQPRRRNQARLLLLVDRYGSMAAFSPLVDALIHSIFRGGLLGATSVYYFHDYPQGALYEHPALTGGRPLEEVLAERAKGASVLFVSDAGAARGQFESSRVRATKECLAILRNYTYLHAWLNPVPARRWKMTSAEELARSVPMFPLDREGLTDAIDILRGHPFPSGVG